METKFKIDLEDYLAYQLYYASTNARIKASRKITSRLVSIMFAFLGILGCFFSNIYIYISFFILAVLSGLFLPLYLGRIYKKSYSRHCEDVYKNNFGEESILTIEDDLIQTKSKSGECTINISQLSEINETGQHYFLQLLSGGAIIVPKNKLNNLDEFEVTINEIAKKLNIEQKINLNWKWK